MGRPRKTQISSISFTSQGEVEQVETPGEPPEKKKSLKKLKAEHLEKKRIKEAEERSKTAKKKEVLAEDTEKQTEELSQGFALLGNALVEILCARLPDPQPPTIMEKQLFSSALTEVAKKYAPALIDYGPEVMLIVSLGGIVLPRLVAKTEGPVYNILEKEQHAGSDKHGAEGTPGDRKDGKREDTPREDAPPPVAKIGDAGSDAV